MSMTAYELTGRVDLDTSPAESKMSGLGGTLATGAKAAGIAIAGLGVAAAGAAAVSLNSFRDFDKGMREVYTLLPGMSQDAMGQLSKDALQLSKDMGVLPNDVVPALYSSISAGIPAGNVFDFLETAQKAAVGGVTDLNTAVDGISSTINAYGQDTLSATQASDLMFTAVRLGKTTFDELSASLFNVNPIASSLGVNFGDVTAALAAMTAQGVPTAQATTQIRSALVEMSKEGTKTSGLFQDLAGQSFKDFIAGGGNVQQALQLLEQHAADTGVGINDLFSSVEAGNAALALTGKGTDAFTNAMGEMQDSAGATQAAYDQMNDGLDDAIGDIKATMSALSIEAGSVLAPVVADLLRLVLEEGVPILAEFGGILKDDVFPPLKAIGGFIGAAFNRDLGGMAEAWAKIPGPLQPIALLLKDVATGIRDVGGALLDGDIGGAVDAFRTYLSNLGETLGEIASGIDWSAVASTIGGAIIGTLSVAGGLAWDAATWIGGMLADVDWTAVATTIGTGITTALGIAGEYAWDAVTWIGGFLLETDWTGIATTIGSGILGALSAGAELVWDAALWLGGMMAEVDWTGLAATIGGGILSALTTAADLVWDAAAWIGGFIADVDWSGIAGSIRDGITGAADALDWSSLAGSIQTGVTGAFDAIKGQTEGDGFLSGIMGDVEPILEELQPIIDLIGGNLSEAFDSMREAVAGMGEAFEGLDLEEITPALKTIGMIIGAVVVVAIIALSEVAATAAEILGTGLVLAVEAVVLIINGAAQAINGLTDIVAGMVGLVTSLIDGDWSGAWDSAGTIVSGFLSTIDGILLGLPGAVAGYIGAVATETATTLGGWVTDAGTKAGELVSGIITAITSLPADVGGKFVEVTTAAITELGVLIGQMPGKGGEILSGLINGILGMMSQIPGTMQGISNSITGFFSDAASWLLSAGGDILRGLLDGAAGLKDWVIGQIIALGGDIKDGVISGIKNKFGIGSPSKVMADEIGQWLFPGISEGVQKTLGPTEDKIRALFADLEGSTLDAARAYFNAVRADGDTMNDWLTHLPDGVRDKALKLGQDLADGLAEAKDITTDAWLDFFGQTDAILSGSAAGQLSETLADLGRQLDLAELVGAPEDVIAAIQAQIDAAETQMMLFADAQRAAIESGMMSAWDNIDTDALADHVAGILDGSLGQSISDELRAVNQTIAYGIAQGWSEELLAQYRAQQAELEAQLLQINQETADAVAAGLIDPIAQLDLAEIADGILSTLDGETLADIQEDLAEINKVIAFGTAEGWSAEMLAAYQAQAATLEADLAQTLEEMAIAAADGLLSEDAQAAYEDAAGIITEPFQIAVADLADLFATLPDEGASMVDELVEAITEGSIGFEEALGLMAEATGENAQAMRDELEALIVSLREDLAQALIDGSDPSEIAENIALIEALLAGLGDAAIDTANTVAQAGKSIGMSLGAAADAFGTAATAAGFDPGPGGGGSNRGGGGGGGSSIYEAQGAVAEQYRRDDPTPTWAEYHQYRDSLRDRGLLTSGYQTTAAFYNEFQPGALSPAMGGTPPPGNAWTVRMDPNDIDAIGNKVAQGAERGSSLGVSNTLTPPQTMGR